MSYNIFQLAPQNSFKTPQLLHNLYKINAIMPVAATNKTQNTKCHTKRCMSNDLAAGLIGILRYKILLFTIFALQCPPSPIKCIKCMYPSILWAYTREFFHYSNFYMNELIIHEINKIQLIRDFVLQHSIEFNNNFLNHNLEDKKSFNLFFFRLAA